jgi:protocatechuate 3,4-dioxygenase alpha subunit
VSTLTPFQTVGPYLSLGLHAGTKPIDRDPSASITIQGRLLDGAGQGIPDGVLEWWHPVLPCVQRSLTGADGSFAIDTVKPPRSDGAASHLALRVLARGILTQYVTRIYFGDEPDNAADSILSLVPEHRRRTLIAQPADSAVYRFDVVVQGDNETVFFDV